MRKKFKEEVRFKKVVKWDEDWIKTLKYIIIMCFLALFFGFAGWKVAVVISAIMVLIFIMVSLINYDKIIREVYWVKKK